MSELNNGWLQSLKVGDKVIVYYGETASIRRYVKTVTKVTPTLIIVGSQRYRKNTGELVGQNSYLSIEKERLEMFTQEADEAIDKHRLELRESQVFYKWFDKNRHNVKDLALAYRALVGAGLINGDMVITICDGCGNKHHFK